MSNSADSSPMSRFSGSDMDFFSSGAFDPTYTADISNRMQVPKKIRVVGGQESERGGDSDEMNGNWSTRQKMAHMHVPDRIMVTGKETHMGAKALPRELQLETVVMPPDPEVIRIQTPPRQITLNTTQIRPESDCYSNSNDEDETLIVENNRARFEQGMLPNGTGAVMSYIGNSTTVGRRGKRDNRSYSSGLGDEDTDEFEHLREQLSRMNRRLLAVEEDAMDRKERERYIVLAGLFYVAYKTVTWLFKTGPPHH